MKFLIELLKILGLFQEKSQTKPKNPKNMQMLPIKKGDKGDLVAQIQKELAKLNYDLLTDGIFGPGTEEAVKDFQKDQSLTVDGIVGNKTYNKIIQEAENEEDGEHPDAQSDDLDIITKYKLSESQYVTAIHDKTQIFLHFTAGAPSARNVISGWDATEKRVATAYVIDGDTGDAYNCFNDKYYGYHLGIKGANGRLDKASVGIEICAWGGLTKKGDKFYNYVNGEVPENQVVTLDKEFRGYKYFHAFSKKQYETLEKLLRYLIKKYDIKIQKSFDENICEFDQSVIDKTKPGLWNHTSVRTGKSDFFSYPEVLEILNKLAKEFNT